MYPLLCIETPTVFINVSCSFCDGLVFPVHPLGLHLPPKAFHGSIIPAVAFVDDIWIPVDLDHIPPTMDGFTFPGNLPGVTFPDVEIPETTLPETLWNSLAFYFQTFDQVATETGAKPVLIIFLIIALVCVMLKI